MCDHAYCGPVRTCNSGPEKGHHALSEANETKGKSDVLHADEADDEDVDDGGQAS